MEAHATRLDREIAEFPERKPAPPALIEMAAKAVQDHSECFWFWHPEARVRFLSDIDLVVRHLREYGGWRAWATAQEIYKCLRNERIAV